MQRYVVALFQQLFQAHILRSRSEIFRCASIDQDVHAEGFGDLDHLAADVAGADDAQGLAVHFRVADPEIFRKVGAVTLFQGADLLSHLRGQVEQHHDGGLGHPVRGIGRNIGDLNALFLAGGQVDVVVARAGFADELDAVRQSPDGIRVHGQLLGDQDFRALRSLRVLFGGAGVVADDLFAQGIVARQAIVVYFCSVQNDDLHCCSFTVQKP